MANQPNAGDPTGWIRANNGQLIDRRSDGPARVSTSFNLHFHRWKTINFKLILLLMLGPLAELFAEVLFSSLQFSSARQSFCPVSKPTDTHLLAIRLSYRIEQCSRCQRRSSAENSNKRGLDFKPRQRRRHVHISSSLYRIPGINNWLESF